MPIFYTNPSREPVWIKIGMLNVECLHTQHTMQQQQPRIRIGSNRVSASSLPKLDPYTLQLVQATLFANQLNLTRQPLPLPAIPSVHVRDPNVAEEEGLWKRFKMNLKKKWWHRAKLGVLGGAGLFAVGAILCACHLPIGGLLIVVGIVVIAGSIVYAIMTVDDGR